MEIYGNRRKSTGINGNLWKSMEINGNEWQSMVLMWQWLADDWSMKCQKDCLPHSSKWSINCGHRCGPSHLWWEWGKSTVQCRLCADAAKVSFADLYQYQDVHCWSVRFRASAIRFPTCLLQHTDMTVLFIYHQSSMAIQLGYLGQSQLLLQCCSKMMTER